MDEDADERLIAATLANGLLANSAKEPTTRSAYPYSAAVCAAETASCAERDPSQASEGEGQPG